MSALRVNVGMVRLAATGGECLVSASQVLVSRRLTAAFNGESWIQLPVHWQILVAEFTSDFRTLTRAPVLAPKPIPF
jgi:hypothetical protein